MGLNRESLKWYRNWHGLVSISLLLGMLGLAVWSLTDANWVTPQPPFFRVAAFAIAAGLLLAATRLPELLSHLISLILGTIIIIIEGVALQSHSGVAAKTADFMAAISAWWHTAIAGQASPGTLQVALLLCLFVWIIGYLSSWYLLRKQNPWVAIFIGAGGLMINLSFLPHNDYQYLVLFLVMGLLLAILSVYGGAVSWSNSKSPVNSRLSLTRYVPAVSFLVVAILTVSWLLPPLQFTAAGRVADTGFAWASKLNNVLYNFFARVPAQKQTVVYIDSQILPFGSGSLPDDDIVCVIQSDIPGYWWNKKYDIYTPQGWESSTGLFQEIEAGTEVATSGLSQFRESVYTVLSRSFTEIPLIQGEFVSISLPASVETLSPGEVVGVVTSSVIKPNQKYTVTSYLPVASIDQLSSASSIYPKRITEHYLQLPEGFSQRISQLALEVTAGASDSLSKVVAIKTFLSTFNYSTLFAGPSTADDGVENFLFNTKTGDCVYFASAMAVMLRSVGVPTRLSAGYIGGEWDDGLQGYTVRAGNAHVWPEVYFTGFGWIPFEATTDSGLSGNSGSWIASAGSFIDFNSVPGHTTMPASTGVVGQTLPVTVPVSTTQQAQGTTSPQSTTSPPVTPGALSPGAGWNGASSVDEEITQVIQYFLDQGYSEPLVNELVERFLGEGNSAWDLYWMIEDELGYGGAATQPVPALTVNSTVTPTLTEVTKPVVTSTAPASTSPAAVSPLTSVPPATNGSSPIPVEGVRLPWMPVSLVALLLLAAAVLLGAKWLLSARSIGGIYARICFLASFCGLGKSPQQTSLEYASRLEAAMPSHAIAIHEIISTYVITEYGRPNSGLTHIDLMVQDSWQVVRRALLRRIFGFAG